MTEFNDPREEELRKSLIPCPDYLPQKFWDAHKGEARLEAMARSYGEMERKIGSLRPSIAPDSFEDYCISVKSDVFTDDPGLNRRLHEAGFSQDQAQLVYDLAHEALEPMIGEIFSIIYGQAQVERLCDHFGGEDRWRETARQMEAWSRNRMSPDAFNAMCSSYEGIMSLYEMMGKGEPGIGSQGDVLEAVSEKSIRKLMRDPRYWRDQDPVIVEQVREGFRRLYPD